MAQWVEEHHVFGSAVKETTKDELKKSKNVIDLLSKAAKSGEEILIMDIGGYFAPCLSVLANPFAHECKWKLLGIVEDTENGHQEYHHALESLRSLKDSKGIQPNIYSVARSRMKKIEDYNVGKSLVRAADSILRQSLDHRLEDHPVIGVLGFGKIGRSIAMHLRQQHIGIVMVYDVNPEILLRASSHDFVISTKEQMLQQASFIFCATGNKALTYNDLMNIGTNIKRLIIASCTSADDELDVHGGFKRHKNKNDSLDLRSFSRYKLQRLNGEFIEIILLYDGNAVNFSHRAVLGESIRSVQAAMIVCALNLQQMSIHKKPVNEIKTLSNEEEMRIARLWLQHFSELDVHLITNVTCARMKFDKVSVEEAIGDLPVDKNSIKQLKENMGLEKAENTDPIDFMNSIRKLIITSSRGSGKTAVLFAFIQDVRNYYDLIWWFDCNDSLHGTLLSLAQEFHVSSVECSIDELQEAVLEAVFSSLVINNILLVIDNVHEVRKKSSFEVTANIASIMNGTNDDTAQRQFKCHGFLDALDNSLNSVWRRQRRCHVMALYTEGSANQPPSIEPPSAKTRQAKEHWLYLPLQVIVPKQAENWVIEHIPRSLNPEIKVSREKLIRDILSVDARRLTIRLTKLFLTSEQINDDELVPLKSILNERRQHTDCDILSDSIGLALKKLKKDDEPFFLCAQVASLIHTGSISREVFRHIYDILCRHKKTEIGNEKFVKKTWDPVWQDLFSKYKIYCILRQNFLVPMIHIRVSQRPIPSEYVEVYSIQLAYARALNKPLLDDAKSPIWKYALRLINEGFNYNYYDFGADKSLQYDGQNIVHYIDHATALIKHTDNWSGNEKRARLRGELLCRLGSYYLNERRMYCEATESYSKAKTIFDKIIALHDTDSSKEKHSSLLVSKWSATLMWHICNHLSPDSKVQKDKKFIEEIKKTRNELEKISINLSRSEKNNSKRYQVEATIAIARIHIQIVRDQGTSEEQRSESLNEAKTELEKIQNEENIGARTRSLLLQVLGSTYSLLKDHKKAIKSYRGALTLRESILMSEHLDVARTKYRFALCLVEYINNMSDEDRTDKTIEVKDKLNEAQLLCKTAFAIQKTQLSIEHRNLTECSDLRQRIEKLFEEMKSTEDS